MAFFLLSTPLNAYINPINSPIKIEVNPTHSKKLILLSTTVSILCTNPKFATTPLDSRTHGHHHMDLQYQTQPLAIR